MKTVKRNVDGLIFAITYPDRINSAGLLEEIAESIFKRDDLIEFHALHDEANPFYFRTAISNAKIVGGYYE